MTRRLLVSYLSLTLLVLLALEIPLGVVYARGETGRFLAAVERDAVVLAERAEEAIEEGDTAAVPPLLADYVGGGTAQVTVVDPRGAVLSRTGQDGAVGVSGDADIAAALRSQRRTSGLRTDAAGMGWLSVTVPATSGEKVRGALRISYPTGAVDPQVTRMWWILAAAGVAVLALAAAVAVGLARWITRPVRELERATTRLACGSLSSPPPADLGPPELRRLAATFTTTAERLQQLLQAQRSFAADASHQLKTPLTALRLRLENLHHRVDPDDQPGLDDAIDETDRLTRMVHGLLALARLDTATETSLVDADAVIADRADCWAPFAAEHAVTLAVSGQPIGAVYAVPDALEQVLDNLLANALRVAPPGSTLTIHRGLQADGRADIHVIDQGPGMTAADRQRAFDRFWRAPGSAGDGSGLGLAIVQRLVHASGGRISLDQASGTGIDAVVRLARPIPGRTAGRSRNVRHSTSSPIDTLIGSPATAEPSHRILSIDGDRVAKGPEHGSPDDPRHPGRARQSRGGGQLVRRGVRRLRGGTGVR
ncbi:sensor histidine kinase [Krasilnikovia sp. MM14-A1004]|uniref:sensor histidine kinase n=1 Tax=Krasilnikovia sp. MM14-A1004 TaxID=3373541 RepID=UPI00399C6310